MKARQARRKKERWMENLFMGGGFNIINFLLLLLFGYTYKSPYLLITEGLYMTGVWKILEKSGIPGWWALIPGAREYQLARCAGREPEGRPLSVAAFITRVLRVLGLLPLLALKGAMEFLSNPSLFILDEPDSGLDGVMARELFVQLRKIADTGKIVIVITHTPDRVIDLFDFPAPKRSEVGMVGGNRVDDVQLYYRGVCANCLKQEETKC